MNFLFHCWEFPPNGSGIGRYVQAMSRALVEAGHHAVVFTSRAAGLPKEEQADDSVRIIRDYDIAEIGQSVVTDRILRLIERFPIDCIEGVDHLGESADLLSRKDRPPVLIKCHYNDVLKVSRYALAHYGWQRWAIEAGCWRDRKRIARERISIERADALLACSHYMLDALHHEKLALPLRREVIGNPIAIPENWQNAETTSPTLLLVGRIDIAKGIEYVPKILRGLRDEFPNLKLEIAGSDARAFGIPSFRRWLIRRLDGLNSMVRFLGRLDHVALDETYRRAWVVIVPSRWDTFPTVVLEAMARAKPVVASPFGGMAEMLENTSCCIADPASETFVQGIRGFLRDGALRGEAGRSAQQRVACVYSPSSIVSKHLQFVRSLCET